MATNIKHIIKACLQRDANAQKALYELYVDRLYYTAVRYVKDPYYIENILQDVFLKVFNKLDSFDERKASFTTWINTITIRTCLNHLRKKDLTFDSIDNIQIDFAGQIDPLLAAMEAEELLEIIEKIPHKYRIVFNLYEVDGYSHEEIGKILDCTTSTSRSYLSRAKKLLQKEIGFCVN